MRSQYRLQIMDCFLDSSGTYLPEVQTWRTPAPRKVEPSLSSHLVASAISPLYLCTWTFVNGKPWRIGLSGKAVRSAQRHSLPRDLSSLPLIQILALPSALPKSCWK